MNFVHERLILPVFMTINCLDTAGCAKNADKNKCSA